MSDDLKKNIQDSIESMWEFRFSTLESKMDKMLSELGELKSKVSIIDDKIADDEASEIQKPITETYIDVILNKITYLKNLILSRATGNKVNFFSPSLVLTESIEKQIIEQRAVSAKQLHELNSIYERELKNKK